MSNPPKPLLQFGGLNNLVQRLVVATLTGQAIRISNIRSTVADSPGLNCHEVSFLRLLEAITNGSEIEFSPTGTSLVYRPGLLVGSLNGYGADEEGLRHDIPADCSRGVSYFIEPLCVLSPFCKGPVHVLFTGLGVITSATRHGDISVDTLRTAMMPLLTHFGVDSNLEVRVLRRSCPGPGGVGGNGEVQVHLGCQVRLPKTLHLVNPGKIKRIRGFAYSTGISATNNARIINAARNVLNEFVSDIYIFSDSISQQHQRKDRSRTKKLKKTGLGFGLSLVAESTTSCLYSADTVSSPSGGEAAEELGQRCAHQLLEAIQEGGCVSIIAAPMVLLLMAMGSGDVGRLQIGKRVAASATVIQLARDLQAFGMGLWTLKNSSEQSKEAIINIFGHGVGNIGRKIV